MKFKLGRLLLISILVVSFFSVGWYIYSSNKSNNEVPKKAKLVENLLDVNKNIGVVLYK
ncbi:hypothetical protein [Dethiothermospora halolimnae]|uniref:hypothetical protein n=1 Tax=Dethiothermospora halolimnae TaxID=3114390 RepID=UPI003CCC123D